MANLDGQAIAIGDTVYDVAYGSGQVTELLVDDRFRVRFADGSYHVYTPEGITHHFANKTVFWHNPIVAVPMKSDTLWGAAAAIAHAVVEALRNARVS